MRKIGVLDLVLLGIIGLVVSFAVWPFCRRGAVEAYFNDIPFDAAAWKEAGYTDPYGEPVRVRMVDDLLRRHGLVGMSRAGVNDLLGHPNPKCHVAGYDSV